MGCNGDSMGLMGDTCAMGLNGICSMGVQWVTLPMGLNGFLPMGPMGLMGPFQWVA